MWSVVGGGERLACSGDGDVHCSGVSATGLSDACGSAAAVVSGRSRAAAGAAGRSAAPLPLPLLTRPPLETLRPLAAALRLPRLPLESVPPPPPKVGPPLRPGEAPPLVAAGVVNVL